MTDIQQHAADSEPWTQR